MKNLKEILRRLVKYLILTLSLGFIIKSSKKLNNYEIMKICLLTGLIYCILDVVSPSIKLQLIKN